MEFNIKFDEQMMVEVANRVLDEFKYNGKTIREWADTLAHPKTNADRLRAMSDEDLAVFIRDQIIDRNIGIPTETWLSWLKSPVEVDNG